MSRELNWALHEGKFRVVSLIGSWPAAFMVITGGCWVWDRMLLEVDVIRKFVLITENKNEAGKVVAEERTSDRIEYTLKSFTCFDTTKMSYKDK